MTMSRRDVLVAFAIGSVVFICVTGGRIILPTNRDWLMQEDPATHYLGWAFFRSTPLVQWPLGLNPRFGLEYSNSIVYSDSIPGLALFFKMVDHVLPSPFQYFGIWIWACFVLQYFWALKLLVFARFPELGRYLAAGFFVLSPPLLNQLEMGNLALGAHWVVLAALTTYARRSTKNAPWLMLSVAGALIHFYLVPMILAIWCAHVFGLYRTRALGLQGLFLRGGLNMVATLAAMYALGYFVIGRGFGAFGFGQHRLNLVSLFDGGASTTRRFSRLGADILTFSGDEEGFVFLGLGVLSCVLICSIGRLSAGVRDRTMIPALPAAGIASAATTGIVYLLGSGGVTSVLWGLFAGVLTVNIVPQMRESATRRRASDWLPLAVTLLALALFAMSHSVAIGEYRLPSISMSDYVSAGLGTLRATGRFAWPGYYMLMLACFWFAGRMARGRLIIATAVLCLTFQTVDLWPAIMRLNERFSRPTSWVSVFKDPRWEEFASKYRAVRVFPLENPSTESLSRNVGVGPAVPSTRPQRPGLAGGSNGMAGETTGLTETAPRGAISG